MLDIARSAEGRSVIATNLFYLYADGGFASRGIPLLGEVFARERPLYVRGKTSLPWCTRDGKP
jgi:hypothetical protein